MKEQKEKLLLEAAKLGDAEAIKSLLADDVDINAKICETTALCHSVYNKHLEATRAILQHDPSIIDNPTNHQEDRPLHLAVRQNDINMLRLLVRYNANPNVVNRGGNTPLQEADRIERIEMATLLIDNNADVNCLNLKGNCLRVTLTPLCLAAMQENLYLVGLLVQNGADTSILTPNGASARDLYERRRPSSEFDEAVLAAQKTITDNMLLISKSLEYSSQLVGLPYLASCFGIIGEYVGGYGKRLDDSILAQLSDLVVIQSLSIDVGLDPTPEVRKMLTLTSVKHQVTKRKQEGGDNETILKKCKVVEEDEEEIYPNVTGTEDSKSSSSSSNSPDSPSGGDSVMAHSAELSEQQSISHSLGMEQLSNYGDQQTLLHAGNDKNDISTERNVLIALFAWIKDLPQKVQQQILSSFGMQRVLKVLESTIHPDKFISDQLDNQAIEEKFTTEHKKYYGHDDLYKMNSQVDAQVKQCDSLVFLDKDVGVMSGGMIIDLLPKHDINLEMPYLFGDLMS